MRFSKFSFCSIFLAVAIVASINAHSQDDEESYASEGGNYYAEAFNDGYSRWQYYAQNSWNAFSNFLGRGSGSRPSRPSPERCPGKERPNRPTWPERPAYPERPERPAYPEWPEQAPRPVRPSCKPRCKCDKPNCPTPPPRPQCVNKWSAYSSATPLSQKGVRAGIFEDPAVYAYVGKVEVGDVFRAGPLTAQGLYASIDGTYGATTNGVSYLESNSGYNYRWEDASGSATLPNAVLTDEGGVQIARTIVNGKVFVGYVDKNGGAVYNDRIGNEHRTNNFQVLVCDPKPQFKCGQQWKDFGCSFSILEDGFNFNANGSTKLRYIGRHIGCTPAIGSIITTPVTGIVYLDDNIGRGEFDTANAQYLVKNSSYNYEWKPSSGGAAVDNALTFGPNTYIARVSFDGETYIGTVVRSGDGIVFIDECSGVRNVVGNYEILTCLSPYDDVVEEPKEVDPKLPACDRYDTVPPTCVTESSPAPSPTTTAAPTTVAQTTAAPTTAAPTTATPTPGPNVPDTTEAPATTVTPTLPPLPTNFTIPENFTIPTSITIPTLPSFAPNGLPYPNQCVTWKPYQGDNGPEIDGYSVGTYIDGTEAYVGVSYITGLNVQPGRLRITNPPTLYLSYYPDAYEITENILYMSVSPNCTCGYGPMGFTTPGVVMVGIIIDTRITDETVTGTPYFIVALPVTYLGRNGTTVARQRLDNTIWYNNVLGNDERINDNKPVLVCLPKPNTVVTLQEVTGAPVRNNLGPNQCLFYGEFLTSTSGCFTFGLLPDGNAVLRKKNSLTNIFQTNTVNSGAFQMCLRSLPGDFVVYGASNFAYSTNSVNGTILTLEDNGNLVLRNEASVSVWSSNTVQTDVAC